MRILLSDSSSNVRRMEGTAYTAVPMKINAGDREFVDLAGLDPAEMVEYLESYKGKSGSSCPNVGEWMEAMEGAEEVFCVTISGGLSGSYNAACRAVEEWRAEVPGRKGHVFDSKTAGPEMALILEKLRDLTAQGLPFETVKEQVTGYFNRTHTIFCLESMMNLARNGRVSMAVARIAGMLGIRVVGYAADGQLEPVHKPRGEKKSLETIVEMMEKRGLKDGAMVRIAHCLAPERAERLKAMILERFPGCRFVVEPTGALCSFYAEVGGLMIGFEGDENQENHW